MLWPSNKSPWKTLVQRGHHADSWVKKGLGTIELEYK